MTDKNAPETKEPELKFYYNRERRLAKAGPYARFGASLAEGKRPGLFRTMTATRSLSFLFFTLLLLAVAVFAAPLLKGDPSRGQLGGISYRLDALWFQDSLYLSLSRSGEPTPGSVAISLELSGKKYTGSFLDDTLEFKASYPVPVKPDTVTVLIESEGQSLSLSAEPR